MKKPILLLSLFSLGLLFVGCEASISTKNLFSSTFSRLDTGTSRQVNETDIFERKAFKTQSGEVLYYQFLRPIGENSQSSYPLIFVVSQKNHLGSYLRQGNFQNIYPAYVVIPEFDSLEDLSQLLIEVEAYLHIAKEETYLITEEKSILTGIKLANLVPQFFSTIVLTDTPILPQGNTSRFLKNRFFLFANKNRKNVVQRMKKFEESVLNYGGNPTSVLVNPADGNISRQVYDDQEFWIRLFQLTP